MKSNRCKKSWLFLLFLCFSIFSIHAIPVKFKFHCGDQGFAVFLTGDFNDWAFEDSGYEMEWEKGYFYSVTVDLEPGTYRYKYIIDGEYTGDMSSLDGDIFPAPKKYEDDGKGGENAVIAINDSGPGQFSPEDYINNDPDHPKDPPEIVPTKEEKSWLKRFAEAKSRLKSHPENKGLYLDPGIAGDWLTVFPGPAGSYSVKLSRILLNKDGKGTWEHVPFYLMKDGSLQQNKKEVAVYDISWGVDLHTAIDGSPVTLLRLVFAIDGSMAWMYYARKSGTLVSLLGYYPETNLPADYVAAMFPGKKFLDAWNKNTSKVRDALLSALKSKQDADVAALGNQIVNDTVFMNTMGTMGTWWGGPENH